MARMGDRTGTYRVLMVVMMVMMIIIIIILIIIIIIGLGRSEEKRPFGKPRRRRKDIIKKDIQERDGVAWTGFVWIGIKTVGGVHAVMNLQVP